MNQDPTAKAIWKNGDRVQKWIGIDADESHRAKIKNDEKYSYVYPLIQWDMGRPECAEAMQRAGLPVPKKSSCFFCPATKLSEILALKSCNPDLLDRALALEANAELTTMKGLGRRHSWREIVDANDRQQALFPVAISCDCYDG